jgi:hypothetical protein
LEVRPVSRPSCRRSSVSLGAETLLSLHAYLRRDPNMPLVALVQPRGWLHSVNTAVDLSELGPSARWTLQPDGLVVKVCWPKCRFVCERTGQVCFA